MTILDTLPALRAHGTLQVGTTPLHDLAHYRRLLLDAPGSGRCPVLLAGHVLAALPEGWDAPSALAELERCDAAAVLAAGYPTGCLYHRDCLAPYGGTFPGLAPATTGAALLTPEEVVEAAVDEAEVPPVAPLLGLAAVGRPADVPAAVGWSPPGDALEAAAVSAVLRSWEDRFGAVLVRIGPASLELAVAAPPWERSECVAITAEHYAFCDDTFAGNPGTLRDHATLLRGAPRWSFWWG
jgi:hypothetical protein